MSSQYITTDITARYNKQYREQYSDKSYTVPRLKNIIFNNENVNGNIKEYIGEALADQSVIPGKSVYRLTHNAFKDHLLNEASLQFNKALYNWSSYKRLVTDGMWSWAYVTLYYAQFYAINGLLNLQGNVFTRPKLLINGEEKECQFHIYTEDFESGVFYMESRRLNKPHEDCWRQYYKVYDGYRYKLPYYNELYQFDQTSSFSELKRRHYQNYDISYQFLEYEYTEEELYDFKEKMSKNVLTTQNRDESLELEYIATLRIKLLFEILDEILSNQKLLPYNENFNRLRKDMLTLTNDNTSVRENFFNWVEG